MMLTQIIRSLLLRDLQKLQNEISSYQREASLWKTDKNISNSAGNLCLHLVGNLNTYIGAVLGNSGYLRDREAEFSRKNFSQTQLVEQIVHTRQIVDQTMREIDEAQLEKDYPLLVLPERTTTGYFLAHLTGHLNYHLGQINYHRRLLDV
jgi:uncharacterized damage-inducible protein DinB